MKLRLTGIAIGAVALAVCRATAAQADEGRRIIHDSWSFKDDAPEAVRALAQTADGYLWVGCPAGLYRFDGVRFELFRSPFGEQLQSTNVSALFAPASGGLWAGYVFGGFSFLKNGRVTNFVEATGTVYQFAQGRDGAIWAAAGGGLWRLQGGRWQRVGAEWNIANPKTRVTQMGFDRDGRLWVLRGLREPTQLLFLEPGAKKFRKAGDGLLTESFTWDADQHVLTTHEKAPAEPEPGTGLEGTLPAYPILKRSSDQILDRNNGIWFLPESEPYLWRHPAGEQIAETVRKASHGNSEVYDINLHRHVRFVDREGGFWAADQSGIHRFSYSPLMEQEIPKAPGPLISLAPDTGGAVWITAGNGLGSSSLYHVVDGKVSSQRAQAGVANFAYTAPDGTFWSGGEGGLWHLANGRLTEIPLPREMAEQGRSLTTITQDRSGGIWVSFGPLGLYLLKDGVWVRDGGRHDLPASGVVIEFTDQLGRIWFGFTKNELAVLDGNRVQTFGAKDGLQAGNVTAISGRGPEVWIGGEFGLQQFDHGKFHRISAVDQTSLRGISGIVETANGDLWLNGLGGILHIRREEILHALKEPGYPVRDEHFGRREGLPGLASQLRHMPTAVEGTDGHLWFTAHHGVVWLDPARASNKAAPPVATLESISADDKGYLLDQPLKFPAGTSSVQIAYAAISLRDPEAVRFRYKLRETDKDWHDAGTSNAVSYRNLSPGSYHFIVNASDTNGMWPDNAATAEFTVLPAFYQTNWFRALTAAIVIALAGAAYRFRLWQVEREARQLRDVIETIPAYVWSAEPDGSVDFMNGRWLQFTGFSLEQAMGWGWAEAVHPDDRTRLEQTLRGAIALGKPVEAEARIRSADGQYRRLLFQGEPLRDRSGKIVKWYGKSVDIEDRERLRELEAELAHTNRVSMMGEMAASIAHEVNQPLSGIVSNGSACLRFLARDQPDLGEVREAVSDIVRDGKRAGQVITRIRSLTKKASAAAEKIDLNETVQEVLALTKAEAYRTGVSIRTQLVDELPPVCGDRVQVQQVLLNLIMNGMEAMSGVEERPRTLTISTRAVETGQAEVSVEDSGTGLDPSAMAKVFEPFYTTKAGGMGMGLSISRSIVQNHGGRLWATANHGPGTTFHFTLPTEEEDKRNAGAVAV